MSDWTRTQAVEAIIASGLAKKSLAYRLVKTISYVIDDTHPKYDSEEVRAWIAARVIASRDDAPR
jgi:hypothetical protein